MIRALNVLRRELGMPTVPTITGTRTASRQRRKQWRAVLVQSRYRTSDTMEHYRDLEACPDNLLGEPNARALGRFVRMARAVRVGFETPIRGVP
jgi:hypothetical protein